MPEKNPTAAELKASAFAGLDAVAAKYGLNKSGVPAASRGAAAAMLARNIYLLSRMRRAAKSGDTARVAYYAALLLAVTVMDEIGRLAVLLEPERPVDPFRDLIDRAARGGQLGRI